MLTEKDLLLERPHPGGIGGVQRLYRYENGYGLSVVNSTMLHSYSFAWEIAVVENMLEDGEGFDLTYDTELTNDVEVFSDDAETNAFIEKAASILATS